MLTLPSNDGILRNASPVYQWRISLISLWHHEGNCVCCYPKTNWWTPALHKKTRLPLLIALLGISKSHQLWQRVCQTMQYEWLAWTYSPFTWQDIWMNISYQIPILVILHYTRLYFVVVLGTFAGCWVVFFFDWVFHILPALSCMRVLDSLDELAALPSSLPDSAGE